MLKEIRIEDISCLDNLSAKLLWHICLAENTTTENLVYFSGAHKDTISRKMSELVKNGYVTKNKEGRNVIYKSNMEKLEINRVKAYKKMDAKDFIKKFCDLFYQVYSNNYCVNWGKDMKLVKNKLIDFYTEEDLNYILEQTFKDYDRKYANAKYKRPSIGAITTFLPNIILHGKTSEKISEKETEEDYEKYYSQDF